MGLYPDGAAENRSLRYARSLVEPQTSGAFDVLESGKQIPPNGKRLHARIYVIADHVTYIDHAPQVLSPAKPIVERDDDAEAPAERPMEQPG